MKGSGIAVALDHLGRVIDDLIRDNDFKAYRVDECEKEISKLREENEALRKKLDAMKNDMNAAAEMRCSNG